LFNANAAIVQLYHGESKLMFNEMMIRSALYYTNTLIWICIVLAHRNNILRIDTSPKISLFRANQSWIFLPNAVCLVKKQQIQIA